MSHLTARDPSQQYTSTQGAWHRWPMRRPFLPSHAEPVYTAECLGIVESIMHIKNRHTRMRSLFAGTALCLGLSACAGISPTDTLPTVPSVDLARYAGTWHEIARLPMWFQRHCVDSTATYTIRADGAIGVHNECVTDTGGHDEAEGIATVVDPRTNARLRVVFDNFFAQLFGSSREGNYWILALDPDYQTVMVGTPDRRYLWILSRSRQLDEPTYNRLVEQAKHLGFPVSRLLHIL